MNFKKFLTNVDQRKKIFRGPSTWFLKNRSFPKKENAYIYIYIYILILPKPKSLFFVKVFYYH